MEDLDSFQCIEMAVFDANSLSGTYQAMNGAAQQADTGSVGFQDDIKILKIYNDGSTGVTISFNGVVKHDYLPSKGTQIIDLQTNHKDWGTHGTGTLNGRKGQIVYGKGSSSTAGLNIYITGYR
jgi:hypothetical protein